MAEELLTREQVLAVAEFSQALYQAEYGVYTPWLSNQLMVGLNNNPQVPTIDKIKKALADYKYTASELQSYTEFMQKWDMLFTRTLYAYVNMLSFDLQVVCSNAYTKADYDSNEFLEDKKRVYSFLDKFDYKSEFRKMAVEMMRRETAFVWFRKTKAGNKGAKYAIQMMPQERCILTGYWEKGLLYDLDMAYWLQPGVDIDGFDPAIKKYFNRVFGSNLDPLNYRPTNPLDNRDGTFSMYTQTSPEDGAWAFKFDMSNFNSTPFLAPLLKNALRDEEIAQLQYNKDFASAYAILAGEIKLFDTAKSGTKADQFAISPTTLGGFMAKVKNGLPNEFKAVAMPTENIKKFQFEDNNKEMLSNHLTTTSGTGISANRILYSNDRMSNSELEAAIINDYNTIRPLYAQFNNFLEFFINKITKKYHFKFILDGSNYKFERAHRFENLMKLADKGIVLNSSAYASVIGMRPMDFDYSLTEGKYGDMQSKLSMLLNANTMKDGAVGGRPLKDSSDLSDSGAESQDFK